MCDMIAELRATQFEVFQHFTNVQNREQLYSHQVDCISSVLCICNRLDLFLFLTIERVHEILVETPIF